MKWFRAWCLTCDALVLQSPSEGWVCDEAAAHVHDARGHEVEIRTVYRLD